MAPNGGHIRFLPFRKCIPMLLLLLIIVAIKLKANVTNQNISLAPSALFHAQSELPDLEWWKYTPIYQIYPRSFQDSDGDGIGDLGGITSRIPYLYDLGIKAVWLTPVYQSPMADFGYDISDYTKIDPIFGTMEDFQELLDELHKRGMFLIMDFVPNHTSDQHGWFNKSIHSETPYTDYYVWCDQPNNWIAFFGNSSWEYEPIRGQYYLHTFLPEQPDLNYRSEHLCQEMLNVLRFWVEKGVDGLRIDAIAVLVEHEEYLDEPRSHMDVPSSHYDYLNHTYTKNQNETYNVVEEWTKYLNEFGASRQKKIISVAEVIDGGEYSIAWCETFCKNCCGVPTEGSNPPRIQYYKVGIDFPFNFNLIRWVESTSASHLRDLITTWMDIMPIGKWPNWVMGNHDFHRVATRLGGRIYIDIANMLLLLLPGTPVVYYGDEIGMINAEIDYEDARDPFGCNWGPEAYLNFSRDPQRTPMLWDNNRNAGFTIGKPWLPLSDDWKKFNVEQQLKDSASHLSIFKSLVQLRRDPVFQNDTNLKLIDLADDRLFAFIRESEDSRYVIVFNLGHDRNVASIEEWGGLQLEKGRVIIRSRYARFNVGTDIHFDKPFHIENAEGYVIKLI